MAEQKTYLIIPFEKKDEFKKDFKIKWDADKKLWYYEGAKINDALHPYTIKKVYIEYDQKDVYRKKFKSLKWDGINKIWLCSNDDYENMGKYTNDEDDITSLIKK